MAQIRPALTVDVGAAQQTGRGGTRQNGKAALAHATASASAPLSNGGGTNYNGQKNGIQPGDIISEDDLAAQGGFSSDEEGQDIVGSDARRPPLASHSINIMDPSHQMAYNEMDSRDFIDSEESEEEDYGPEAEGEMMSDEDDEQYDEDEELSSSPSIPDENIDFDLVYALHNFIATVEGQATVNKGNSLTLLDDSNSYWWLVRVLRTQEVGYIPAENIETPYERLARLNKHRNVDLTSATDDDHIQVPEKIYTSHLIKQRSFGSKGFSSHSGKLSALSRRNHGPKPKRLSVLEESKHGVQFGPNTFLEHSGNEYSDDDDDDDDYDDENDIVEMDEDHEEEEGAEEDDNDSLGGGDDEDEDDYGVRQAGGSQLAGRGGTRQQYEAHDVNASRKQTRGVEHMDPDDGMEWDGRETERVQRATEERSAAKQASQQRADMGNGVDAQRMAQQQKYAQRQPAHLQNPQDGLSEQQQQGQTAQSGVGSAADQLRAQARIPPQQLQSQNRNSDRLSSSTMSSTGSNSGFLPSQLQAARERPSSDASAASKGDGKQVSAQQQQLQPKSDKRSSLRKSRGEDELVVEEKQGKKRSGVFSGLFSRSKDKKERKSGHFSQGSIDSDNARLSEDSSRQSLLSGSGQNATGAGRAVQERDRLQQEAYQRQFLQDGRPARPGSLIATPGSAPMLNVLRVFAGNEVDSSATFKTVLLNQSTTAGDLLKQVLQRFRLGVIDQQRLGEYCLTIKLSEGDERILEPNERPLLVLDKLTETMNTTSQDFKGTLPSVKRSSVGSISSVSSNLSLNPAIARLESDFSDDHLVKLYLHRRDNGQTTYNSQAQSSNENSYGSLTSPRSAVGLAPSSATMDRTGSNNSTDELSATSPNLRFPLRLLIFPSDLPEGIVFDPQTNALVPHRVLSTRGPAGQTAVEGITQDYREKLLALPRNSTVAEVIEQGLERFGILDGVVEGGDDVEDRSSRRRSKSRVRYGLSVKVGESERTLQPSSRVLDAFSAAPTLRPAPVRRRSKRSSTDSAMLLSMAEDIRTDDPVFILRQVQRHSHKPSRPLSPTENILATRQGERRQAELSTVAAAPSSKALEEARGGGAQETVPLEQQGLSRQELIAAQRAAARERRAAVLATQPNQENGVDVVLNDRSRLRSSRMLDTGKVRYSFIPVSGEEHDISAIVEDVLRTGSSTPSAGLLSAPQPPPHISRQGSAATIEDYVSAVGSPAANTPLSLSEVNAVMSPPGAEGNAGHDDALQRLVRNGDTDETSVEDRIDQVLARLGGTARTESKAGDGPAPQSRSISHTKVGSIDSSRGTASPLSGNTHPSGTTTPTPLSMLAASGSASAALAAVTGLSSTVPRATGNTTAAAAAPMSSSSKKQAPFPSGAMSDAGIAQLYAVAEAAARKKPPRKRSTRAFPHGVTISQAPPDDTLQTSIAGLFPPMAPYIEDRKIKDAYAPIGRHLNGLEDTLDQLLADAMKI